MLPSIAAAAAGLVLGCLKDAPVAPAQQGVHLMLNANVIGAQVTGASGSVIAVDVFYKRTSGTEVSLPSNPAQVAVPVAATIRQPVVVQIANCLSDDQRAPAGVPGCLIDVRLRLEDPAGAVVDSATTVSPTPALPGQTVILSSVPLSSVSTLVVGPASATIVKGQTLQLTDTAKDVGGHVLPGRSVTWSSSADSVASVSATGLVTGIASAAKPVTITAETGGKTASTQITVTPPPAIGLSAGVIHFGATRGGAIPAQQVVTISNTGGGTLAGLAVGAPVYSKGASNWLQATLAGTRITLAILSTNLSSHADTASVAVSASNSTNSPQTVTVVYTIGQGPVIRLTPSTPVTFTAVAGGASPSAMSVQVANGGGGTLSGISSAVSYAAGKATSWLTAKVNSTTAPAALTLQASIASLPSKYDTLKATVTIASSVAGVTSQSLAVTMFMAPAPSIVLTPSRVAFAAQIGAAIPAARSVAVTNGGGGALGGLALGATTYHGTATNWLNAALSGTTLSIDPKTSLLSVGVDTAFVPVTATNAPNSPRVDTVVFTITQGPVISATPKTLTFTATYGGANPDSQIVAISNSGGGTLTGLTATVPYAVSQKGWLVARQPDTSAPTQVMVLVNTALMAAGTYTGGIVLSTAEPGVNPDTVIVSLRVAPLVFSSISSGAIASTMCAIASTGRSYCWGSDSLGEAGDNRTNTIDSLPRLVLDSNVTLGSISVGHQHTCAQRKGTYLVQCWGSNQYGMLGSGFTGGDVPYPAYGPIAYPPENADGNFSEISTGKVHTCGLIYESAYCWGFNGYNALGDSTSIDRNSPEAVKSPSGVNFTHISAGYAQTCAVAQAGTAYCWGYNYDGELGTGDTLFRIAPAAVIAPPGVTFIAISTGSNHTCALSSSGAAYCWGATRFGMLGDGDTASSSHSAIPVQVAAPPGVTFTKISAGGLHTCALTAGGAAYCWGYNLDGELGNGTRVNSPVPTAVTGPTGLTFADISGGEYFTCGLAGIAVYCWGANGVGQLGNLSTRASPVPVPIAASSPDQPN
jgi:alpha-tubulin suppressor-like RCC1 family protein